MKIAIMGAGVTGAYLYRLLGSNRHNIDIFDKRPSTRCGIKPCAWGTSRGFAELLDAVGLDASTYVLTGSDHVIMDGLRIRGDLMTFDKPLFIRDLLRGAEIRYARPDPRRYERIIDATGVSRKYLPPLPGDVTLPCVQYRIKPPEPLRNEINLGDVGYAWCFPIGDGEYHVGCGSLTSNPAETIKNLGWLSGGALAVKPRCVCRSSIRLTAPHYSEPFVGHRAGRQVWGVGEAIGCVAPLAGDGIVPGMRSAQLLMEWWDSPGKYRRAILKEFRWMKDERRVIDKLRKKERLGLKDAWVLKKNSRRMAMEVGVKQAVTLMNHLR